MIFSAKEARKILEKYPHAVFDPSEVEMARCGLDALKWREVTALENALVEIRDNHNLTFYDCRVLASKIISQFREAMK